jgi:nucleotide-binding universal stress UspA family protein
MRVLIAADGMIPEVPPAQAAANRPWPSGSCFCLLNVFNPYPFTAAPVFQERLKEIVLHNLFVAAKTLQDVGWDTTVEICPGSARKGINKFAQEWRADLVMVGCNDLGDLGRLLLGSTAQAVVRHAPCSVEVARPRRGTDVSARQNGMKILVATDGSEFSLSALRSVADRPWPPQSSVKVISVPEFVLFKDPSYLVTHEVKDLEKASIEDAKLSVAAGVRILVGSELKVCSDVPVFEDRPYRVILREAETWEADMIVVGSHGRTGFDRIVMGSVAEAVALHAQCSVEVIREQKSKGLEI